MHPSAWHDRAKQLVAAGFTQQEAAEAIGVSQRSVSRWVRDAHRRKVRTPVPCPREIGVPGTSYAVLLGFYLGDGHLPRHPRRAGSWCFAITQDARYPGSIDEICTITEDVFGAKPYTRQVSGAVQIRLWTRHGPLPEIPLVQRERRHPPPC